MDTVTFYFSFRSPYAWLAFHRIHAALAGLPVELERVPVFPPPNFPNDPAAVPAKLRYLMEDVGRIAAAYGLTLRWPERGDTNWMRPHAAYVFATRRGCGDAFALQTFAARFQRGADVGDNAVLADVARRCDLDPAAVVRAADDADMHAEVVRGMQRAVGQELFGVPTFIYRGQKFWGNDRIEWLVRTIQSDLGQSVPDPRAEQLARPSA